MCQAHPESRYRPCQQGLMLPSV
ncbi:hypothetical protein VULLAG_LOCUS18799 [Vulpes lagopus]